MERPAGLSRGYAIWLLYGVFGCMAFLLNGLGAVLAPLQRELRVSRGEVAFYPSLFAAGLVIVGLAGGPLVTRLAVRGRAGDWPSSGCWPGRALIAAPARVATLLGALLLGLAAALLIQLVPAVLAAMQPQAPTVTIGEANSGPARPRSLRRWPSPARWRSASGGAPATSRLRCWRSPPSACHRRLVLPDAPPNMRGTCSPALRHPCSAAGRTCCSP